LICTIPIPPDLHLSRSLLPCPPCSPPSSGDSSLTPFPPPPLLDLHLWTERHFLALPDLFEQIPADSAEYKADPCIAAIHDSTEEGKKVARNNGDKYILVWRRKDDPKREGAGWVL
jgi:hypothetical protein